MSQRTIYRIVSALMVFALLLSATPLNVRASIFTAPVKSEASAPLAQSAAFDVSVAIRNRDGTPLSGVNVTRSAYNKPYME